MLFDLLVACTYLTFGNMSLSSAFFHEDVYLGDLLQDVTERPGNFAIGPA